MSRRPAKLQNFILAARAAYQEFAVDPNGRRSTETIFAAIEASRGEVGLEAVKLPVGSHLDEAMQTSDKPGRIRDLLDAFRDLEPELSWRRRPTYDAATASANFLDGHGNCMILGPGGFEERSDLALGASLLAPNVRYPDHDHPPEETYLVVTAGEFRQGDGDWFTPGVGGSFYNIPMIKHAMRSGQTPLLAFWALWMG